MWTDCLFKEIKKETERQLERGLTAQVQRYGGGYRKKTNLDRKKLKKIHVS